MVHQFSTRISVPVALSAMLGATSPAVALGGPAVDTLALGRAVRCTPALPRFCGNVHIGCAGRSRVPTYRFRVARDGASALITPDSAQAAAPPPQVGPLAFDAANGSAIVSLAPAPAYLRISADDRFSLRQYAAGKALMAFGRCAPHD